MYFRGSLHSHMSSNMSQIVWANYSTCLLFCPCWKPVPSCGCLVFLISLGLHIVSE